MMTRFESKGEFNDRLYSSYPSLSKRCNRYNIHLNNDVNLSELATVVLFRSDITTDYLIRMNDDNYYKFLNDLYEHIQKNGNNMIDFWLL